MLPSFYNRSKGEKYNVLNGGQLMCNGVVAAQKNGILRFVPLYRMRLKKMDAAQTIAYAERLVNKYLPWHKRFENSKLMSMLLNQISPVITYYRAFPQLNDKQQEEWALLDAHDSLTDWHKNFRNKPQMLSVLSKLDEAEICCEYGGNGLEARCKKPL